MTRHECIRPTAPREPFRDLADDHVPFPLVRRSHRTLYQALVLTLVLAVCALCVATVLL